jgi:FAD:protein FMN transferase
VNVRTFRAMGCEVVVGGATASELAGVEALFVARERRFSRFDQASELSAVNRATARLIAVSREFAEMLELALDAAAATGGLVVPTLGHAVAMAGYDRDFARLADGRSRPGVHRQVPADAGGWQAITVRGRFVERPPGLALDLNGVVKGRTVDDALRRLARGGFVSAGGDLAVSEPTDVGLPGGDTVRVVSGGLATSSTARRRWCHGGEWRHHLIDAATGLPSTAPWSDVSVSSSTCLWADIAAKAALLRGEDGPAWLDARGLAGRLRASSGSVVLTDAWRAHVPVLQEA